MWRSCHDLSTLIVRTISALETQQRLFYFFRPFMVWIYVKRNVWFIPMLAFVQDNMTCTAFLKKPRPGYKEWVTCLRLHCVTDLKLTIVKNSWWPPLGGDWAKKLKPTWGSSCNTKSPPGVADKGKGPHPLHLSFWQWSHSTSDVL